MVILVGPTSLLIVLSIYGDMMTLCSMFCPDDLKTAMAKLQ